MELQLFFIWAAIVFLAFAVLKSALAISNHIEALNKSLRESLLIDDGGTE